MRRTLERAIVLTVMTASPTCREQYSVDFAGSREKFVDTSTWEQIIRVLEESQESERRTWFSAGK
jgi:hypothetical protein